MISSSRSRLSFKDRRSHQKKRFRFVGVVILVLLIYQVFCIFVLEPWVIETRAMEPGYGPGSRLLVSPYLLRKTDSSWGRLPERGDIVVLHPPYVEESSWRYRLIDPVVRMFTFQKIEAEPSHRAEWERENVFKRVIAVPGDTLIIEDSVVHIREENSEFFISEFEMSSRGYDIQAAEPPEGWTAELPLSGRMEEMTLGEGEYFVVGDNRSASNDSRYWGAVDGSAIRGKVVFSYWPVRSFGRPR